MLARLLLAIICCVGLASPGHAMTSAERYLMVMAGAGSGGGAIPDSEVLSTDLLMHFDGANGGTVFTDETGKVFTRVGTNSVTSNATAKFGFTSLRSYTAASYLQASGATYPSLTYFPGDFTIEFCLYINAGWYGGVISIPGTGFIVTIPSTAPANKFNVTINSGANTGTVFPQDQWFHVAAVRYNGVFKFYINGVAQFSKPLTVPIGGGYGYYLRLPVSLLTTPTKFLYMDELRILNGTAAYRGNFTPPTAPFTVLP